MPAKTSAGLILFRVTDAGICEVLIGHMGGPFWAKKDDGGWSIPKGEYDEGEDPFAVALREFEEELGAPVPADTFIALGEIRQPGGKRVTVWAAEGDFDATVARSNTFPLEWPPRSGQIQEFPEIDRAAWFPVAEARRKLLTGQLPLLDRLMAELAPRSVSEAPAE
jgi:predicted NUDIX family NTP pyrophosphohydrolase